MEDTLIQDLKNRRYLHIEVMNSIDHLVYVASDLKTGMDEIEQLLGMRPVMGGHHPDFGTHNALLALGPNTYLEVIAPDPGLTMPDRGFPFGIHPGQDSKLSTWALRSENIEEVVEAASNAGLKLGQIEAGSRERQDGTLLTWHLTNPSAMLLDGAVPFLISWGRTPHPATHLPDGGALTSVRIEHPSPEHVREAFKVLGVELEVIIANKARIIATIRTPNGAVELC